MKFLLNDSNDPMKISPYSVLRWSHKVDFWHDALFFSVGEHGEFSHEAVTFNILATCAIENPKKFNLKLDSNGSPIFEVDSMTISH